MPLQHENVIESVKKSRQSFVNQLGTTLKHSAALPAVSGDDQRLLFFLIIFHVG